MLNRKIFFLLIILLLHTSCTFLSKKIDSLTAHDRHPVQKKAAVTLKKDFCPDNTTYQYITPDNLNSKFYKEVRPQLLDNNQISFIEKMLTILLFDAIKKPEMSLPFARLQIYFKYNNKTYYYDFNAENMGDFPYLKGVDYLAQKFLNSSDILTLAHKLNSFLPNKIEVSNELESFLADFKQEIEDNDELNEGFIKGDETLTKFETYPRIDLVDFIKSQLPPKKRLYQQTNISSQLGHIILARSEDEIVCNIDLKENPNLSNVLKTENKAENLKRSHYTGMLEKEHFFIATSSSELILPFKSKGKSLFISANASSSPRPFCEFKSKSNRTVLSSTLNNFPAQHLQHLMSYEINTIRSPEEMQELLRFSRHLFLTGPDRILYESKKGRKGQLNLFLSMNFPIYHVESLGNIFGYGQFFLESSPKESLFIDHRSQSFLLCGPIK